MAKFSSLSALFTAIADSIRAKLGSQDEIAAEDIPETIDALALSLQEKSVTPSDEPRVVTPDEGFGGLSSVSVGAVESTVLSATENGTYTPDEGKYYSGAVVNVPEKVLQAEKTVAPTSAEQTVLPDSGYDGILSLKVSAVQTEEKTVTENGTVTPSEGKFLSSVTVNVASQLSDNFRQWVVDIPSDVTTITSHTLLSDSWLQTKYNDPNLVLALIPDNIDGSGMKYIAGAIRGNSRWDYGGDAFGTSIVYNEPNGSYLHYSLTSQSSVGCLSADSQGVIKIRLSGCYLIEGTYCVTAFIKEV